MRKKIGTALIFTLIFSGLVFAGGGGETAGGAKQYKFITGDVSPIGISLSSTSNIMQANLIMERSNGAIQIEHFPASQLGTAVEQIQSLMAGNQTFFGETADWLANWHKDFNVMTWGWTFRSPEHMLKWFASDTVKQIRADLESQHGIKVLGLGAWESRISFFKKPVRSLADIQNIKMRVPEIEAYVRFWEALGTKPTRVAIAEIYMGLNQGLIEGTEMPSIASLGLKLHEAAPYVTLTNHFQNSYGTLMSKIQWDTLTPELQKIVQDAADEIVQFGNEEALKREQEVIKQMEKEGATIISGLDMTEWKQKIIPATAEMEARGMWRKGLYDEIQQIK